MDVLNRDAERLPLLPVALIFQNESTMEELNEFGYDTTTTGNVSPNQSGHSWKKEEVILSGLQKLEKVGEAVRRELKWAFILHTYGFGCLFFILAFYTFFSILNIRSFISNKPFMSTINGFLCLLGTSRAASLFTDPYNLKENMPKLFGQVLWDLGFPSIMSAFCLVQLAFLQFTQLRVGPEGLRRKSCLSLIVTAHFLLTIGMDVVAASHENLLIIKHVVHYIFLMWGVFLCSNFLYSGYKIMSMIKSLPGGLKHKELPDPHYKGLMQLTIFPPHNNLAGSMTAALLPTLCAPKIHQQDNVNLSAVGFRNDGNSRILESESIPMLEEMAGSSGDEVGSKPLVRGSSFQNQTRNSQKFSLKPKLSLESATGDSVNIASVDVYHLDQNSSKPATQKTLLVKTNEFDFGVKTPNDILKHTENTINGKSSKECKNKIHHKTCFENDIFSFSNGKKSNSNFDPSTGAENPRISNGIPEILVTSPGNFGSGRGVKAKEALANEKNQKSLNKLMNEISNDLNEMQILREDKPVKSEERVEVHEQRRNKFEIQQENGLKKKTGIRKYCDCRRENALERKECEFGAKENRENVYKKEGIHPGQGTVTIKKEIGDVCSTFREEAVFGKTQTDQRRQRGKRTGKSLSWKKAEKAEDGDEKATRERLLLQENTGDVSVRSVLNQMAKVNKGIAITGNGLEDVESVRNTKVEWVLNITYVTAMWGLMLCLSNMGKIYSPFGVPEPRITMFKLNSTLKQDIMPTETSERRILLSCWPWLWFQTFCRALELAMGCAMANITRQPTANHFRNRDTFYTLQLSPGDVHNDEKVNETLQLSYSLTGCYNPGIFNLHKFEFKWCEYLIHIVNSLDGFPFH